jgi:hypothetical protein
MAKKLDLIPDNAEDILETLSRMRGTLSEEFKDYGNYSADSRAANAKIAEAYCACLRQDLELRRQMAVAQRLSNKQKPPKALK